MKQKLLWGAVEASGLGWGLLWGALALADADPNSFTDKGLKIEFSAIPADRKAQALKSLVETQQAEVRFRVTDATTGAPVSLLEPAAWIDLAKDSESSLDCRERVSRYLQGSLSFQSDVDLNKYFILILNQDRTISVVDPLLGVSGITQLYNMIVLEDRGEDWVAGLNGKRLFVSLPRADKVAVVDLENFKTTDHIKAGKHPMRVAIQPDSHYIWVGNDGKTGADSGVTVIDAQTHHIAAYIPTGAGHHEIAFSDDSLFAFVTNSLARTVSVIDVQKLAKVQEVPTGKSPIAVRFSSLSQAAYIASEGTGDITVIGGARHERVTTLHTEPGVVDLRFAPGGRWGFIANLRHNRVDILDAATGTIAHRIEVGQQPHQFAFTDTYAYVRHLGSPELTLIPLAQLGAGKPGLQKILVGSHAPGESAAPVLADAVAPAGEWRSILAANPADRLVYHYMEGMVAPKGSYPDHGHIPRAVMTVDHSLCETEKGVYSAKFRVPKAGNYHVALFLDAPRTYHCFSFAAAGHPTQAGERGQQAPALVFLNQAREVPTGSPLRLRFSLTGTQGAATLAGRHDVVVLTTRSPGNWQQRQFANPVEGGVYEAEITPDTAGAYAVFVGVPSLNIDLAEMPYWSFQATEPKHAQHP